MSNRDNSGALFKNDRRETDKHPLYKGQATIEGREYWLSAWMNEAQSGQKYMSIKFEPKDASQRREPANAAGGRSLSDEIDDSVPFAPEWR